MNAKLAEAILEVLVQENGSTSISHLTSELRLRGWRGLSNTWRRFEIELESLGFTLRKEYRHEAYCTVLLRTYVEL